MLRVLIRALCIVTSFTSAVEREGRALVQIGLIWRAYGARREERTFRGSGAPVANSQPQVEATGTRKTRARVINPLPQASDPASYNLFFWLSPDTISGESLGRTFSRVPLFGRVFRGPAHLPLSRARPRFVGFLRPRLSSPPSLTFIACVCVFCVGRSRTQRDAARDARRAECRSSDARADVTLLPGSR